MVVPGSREVGSSTERCGHVEDGRCPVEAAVEAGEGDGLSTQVQRDPGGGELDAVVSSKSEDLRIFSSGFNDMLTYLGNDQGRPIPGKGYACAVDGGLVCPGLAFAAGKGRMRLGPGDTADRNGFRLFHEAPGLRAARFEHVELDQCRGVTKKDQPRSSMTVSDRLGPEPVNLMFAPVGLPPRHSAIPGRSRAVRSAVAHWPTPLTRAMTFRCEVTSISSPAWACAR